MDIELDPPRGISGFAFGTPADAVEAAAARLGQVRVTNRASAERFRRMKILLSHEQFETVFHCEDGATLTAVEMWMPSPGPEEITVAFRGIDVFRTPAREVLRHVQDMGYEIDERDPFHPKVPHLTLGFTRDAGDEVPVDSDELPLYAQAVLVGPEDYYG